MEGSLILIVLLFWTPWQKVVSSNVDKLPLTENLKKILRRILAKGRYELIKKTGGKIAVKMSTEEMTTIFRKDMELGDSFAISKKVAAT